MRRIILITASLVFLAGICFFWWDWTLNSKSDSFYAHKLPNPKEAYDVKLTDQDGKPFQLDQLKGKLVLLTFGFTHCPNICPTILGNLAAMYRNLPPNGQARTRVVFVSVDPERDTPAVMKDYVPSFDEHFIGLTGTADQIKKAAKAYGVVYEKQFQPSSIAGNYYTINHSNYVYVIGPKGKWIALYNYEQLGDAKKIVEDVQRFLASS